MLAIPSILVALALCYFLARERFSATTAALAVAGVAVASPVTWSLAGAPDAGAAIRCAVGSLAAYAWVRASRGAAPRGRWGWAIAGVAAGAAAAWVGGPIASWRISPGDVLWSSRAGLLATSPAVYAGVVGLVLLWRVDRALAAAGLALLALTTISIALRPDWWASAWPSPAAFAALTPYVVCGLAAAIDAITGVVSRRPAVAATAILGVLVLWNLTLMRAARDVAFHLGEPLSFGDVGAAQAQAVHDWVGHPLSAPASLIYAVRNGVRPGAYDLLEPGRLLASGATSGRVDIGTRDAAFIGAGWLPPEQDGPISFRWATRSAFVDVPLDHVEDLVVEIQARPYVPPGGGPQQLMLIVNDHPQRPVRVPDGWTAIQVPVPRDAWRAGVNHLELRFAYDAKPSDSGAPDGRTLAASVDALTVRVAP